ncbi:hypothetical protein DFH09DRAFT_1312845 [Mycena vulgaris]|nr:hypothetical protein DFH09DRAFT_1312845 [Mycena vulgaris]
MAPATWASEDQTIWLKSYMGQYMDTKASGDQIDFFSRLDEAWFTKWPAEEASNLPSAESGIALTPEVSALLGAFIKRRKKSGFETTHPSNAAPPRPATGGALAKKFPEHVKAALEAAGYYTQHASDVEWVGGEGEDPDEGVKRTLKEQVSARMKMWRQVTIAAVAAESDEVKQQLEEELQRIKCLKGAPQVEKLTPELAQMSLDQLEAIIERIHALVLAKTGWVGFTMLGGPMPNTSGALKYSIYSCGHSPAGNTFRDAHPDWAGAVALKFHEWLRRCFSRSARDAMALRDPEDLLDGLMAMPAAAEGDSDAEEAQEKPKPEATQTMRAAKRSKKPSASAASGSIQAGSKAHSASASAMFTSFSVAPAPSASYPSPARTSAAPNNRPTSTDNTPPVDNAEHCTENSEPFDNALPGRDTPLAAEQPPPVTPASDDFSVPFSFSDALGTPGAFSFSNVSCNWLAPPASPLNEHAWPSQGDDVDDWAYGPQDPMNLPPGIGDCDFGGDASAAPLLPDAPCVGKLKTYVKYTDDGLRRRRYIIIIHPWRPFVVVRSSHACCPAMAAFCMVYQRGTDPSGCSACTYTTKTATHTENG